MADGRDEQNADREWLVNQIAHALRNPIFAASVHAESLQLRAADPTAVIRSAEALSGQLERLSTAIDEMLLFGRPIQAEPGPVVVADLLSTLADRYRSGDRQEPAEITTNEVDPDLCGHWNRELVIVILERLLDNAVQHTEQPHEIALNARVLPGGDIELSVADRGFGIPPEIFGMMMLPFFPQHSGRPGLGRRG